jgi:hypothetical protein
MAQVFHFGPYYWFGPFETGLPPGGQHSWSFSWGPSGFARSWFACHSSPRAQSNSFCAGRADWP